MYKNGDLVETLLYPVGIYRPLIARVRGCVEEGLTLDCEIVWWDKELYTPTTVYLATEYVIPYITKQLLL